MLPFAAPGQCSGRDFQDDQQCCRALALQGCAGTEVLGLGGAPQVMVNTRAEAAHAVSLRNG